jgi:hypothetical protein
VQAWPLDWARAMMLFPNSDNPIDPPNIVHRNTLFILESS